jgi:hypothetical protein
VTRGPAGKGGTQSLGRDLLQGESCLLGHGRGDCAGHWLSVRPQTALCEGRLPETNAESHAGTHPMVTW